jgi:dipeptidyl aminopeptidase/acylaminoacyl peptidase
MRAAATRRVAVALFAACIIAALPFPSLTAQTPRTPFSAEDMLNVTTVSIAAISDDGRRIAVTTRRTADNAQTDNYRYGDPTYVSPSRVRLLVIDTATGAARAPWTDLVNVRQAAWAPDGVRLAMLVAGKPGPADPKTGDADTSLFVYHAERGALTAVPSRPPAHISSNSGLAWSRDGAHVIVTLRTPEDEQQARGRFQALTQGPVIVHSSKDPFLDWDGLQRASRTRSVAALDVTTGDATWKTPAWKISSYTVARDGSFLTFSEDVTEKTDYDVIGGTTNALKYVDAGSTSPRVIAEGKDLQGVQLRWSDEGRTFAYAKKGEVFVQGVTDAKPRSLTPEAAPKPGEPDKAKDAERSDASASKESFSVSQLSRDGSRVLVTSKKGWYVVDTASAARRQIVKLEEDEEKNPRMEPIGFSADAAQVYAAYSERDRWERGLVRIDAATGALTPIVKDSRLFGDFRFSRDGRRVFFTASDGDHPAELYVADAAFASPRKLTDLNPWLSNRAVPASELVSYRDTDGKVLYGVLRYPVDYRKGQRYPTIFELYETFFDNGFNARAAFLTSHGYAVFHPSVNLVVGRPGEAWVKGVTSAANKLIEMGVADPDRLGVHGTSYGGYATVLLLTQTDRFKAAVNISGKVDMVSFYTDSPRLGVRNTHAPEKSQDRIGGTLWEYPERYLAHSAILAADRIKTPLLCITGDQDPNVPASQSREIYYALRRLGREVEWVRYVNGAHRPPNTASEAVDFEQRILKWYDGHLKGDTKKKTETSQP